MSASLAWTSKTSPTVTSSQSTLDTVSPDQQWRSAKGQSRVQIQSRVFSRLRSFGDPLCEVSLLFGGFQWQSLGGDLIHKMLVCP